MHVFYSLTTTYMYIRVCISDLLLLEYWPVKILSYSVPTCTASLRALLFLSSKRKVYFISQCPGTPVCTYILHM